MTTSTPPQPDTADRLKNSTTSVDVNLDDDVLRLCDLGDARLPLRKGLALLVLVGSNSDRSTDMVEDDRGLRKGAGEVRKIGELGMVKPGLEGKFQGRETRKPGAPSGVVHLPFRRIGAPPRQDIAFIPGYGMADAAKSTVARGDLRL